MTDILSTSPWAAVQETREGRMQAEIESHKTTRRMLQERAEGLVAENEKLKAALRRMLLEFDFMVEREVIPDCRNDIIFVEARAALNETQEQG